MADESKRTKAALEARYWRLQKKAREGKINDEEREELKAAGRDVPEAETPAVEHRASDGQASPEGASLREKEEKAAKPKREKPPRVTAKVDKSWREKYGGTQGGDREQTCVVIASQFAVLPALLGAQIEKRGAHPLIPTTAWQKDGQLFNMTVLAVDDYLPNEVGIAPGPVLLGMMALLAGQFAYLVWKEKKDGPKVPSEPEVVASDVETRNMHVVEVAQA